ncbi:MAG: hypothetical protein IJ829_03000, partial [Kiritimatiellae bacterium]|nr:hypothetical protein [Kiritimatiellia bacterium]
MGVRLRLAAAREVDDQRAGPAVDAQEGPVRAGAAARCRAHDRRGGPERRHAPDAGPLSRDRNRAQGSGGPRNGAVQHAFGRAVARAARVGAVSGRRALGLLVRDQSAALRRSAGRAPGGILGAPEEELRPHRPRRAFRAERDDAPRPEAKGRRAVKPIELRQKILETVSKNGGHLASSLGAVELAMALVEVFDPETDRIVWDVGHQAYAWKILTGREKEFETLRRFGGLSGFPTPAESRADAAVAGHAGVALSVAEGLAAA